MLSDPVGAFTLLSNLRQGLGMKVHVDLAYVIDPVQERLFHPVSDGVAFIDADFAVHEDGQVDHEELPEAVSLD